MTGPCNNTSVGILVERAGSLLLIERAKYPHGFAPPAGHVEDTESYEQAAGRELAEEVGLAVSGLRLALPLRRIGNRCRRPGGDHHHWQVYAAATSGELVRSVDETRSVRWADREGLKALADRTHSYLSGAVAEPEWQRAPGLEPVWAVLLTELGWIGNPLGARGAEL